MVHLGLNKYLLPIVLGLSLFFVVSCSEDDAIADAEQQNTGTSEVNYDTLTLQELKSKAEAGDLEAMHRVGLAYYLGENDTLVNYMEAFRWFKKAADLGYAKSQNNVGNHYFNGLGVAEDREVALDWFRKAADQGLSIAQKNLGIAYEYGYGIEKNVQLARTWYEKAAEQDLSEAIAAIDRLDRDAMILEKFISMKSLSSGDNSPGKFKSVTFPREHVIGSVDAPLTLAVFISAECAQCLDWMAHVYPRLKNDYIRQNKVRVIFKPIPVKSLSAMYAQMLTSCAMDTGRTFDTFSSYIIVDYRKIVKYDYPAELKFQTTQWLRNMAREKLDLDADTDCWTEENAEQIFENVQQLAAYRAGNGERILISAPTTIYGRTDSSNELRDDLTEFKGACIKRGIGQLDCDRIEGFFADLDAKLRIIQ